MNADKITLARALHDLGVTREWEWKEDDEFYCNGFTSRVYLVEEETLVRDGELYADDTCYFPLKKCFPIPSCDWLWAWLWKNGYRVVQVSDTIYDLEKENTRRGEDDWDWEHQIEAFSLHVALLTACVWVAEKEAANENRP